MITLTREEALKVLYALEDAVSCGDFIEVYKNIKEKLNEPTIDGWPLYSGLPQREWVGLTDEEIEGAIDEGFAFGLDDGNVSNKTVIRYARAIEVKLKEKNT